MTNAKSKSKPKLGRTDRYPSDYGSRDQEERAKDEARQQEERDKEEYEEEHGSWVAGDKGQGREGHSKGYGGSARKGTGPSGPERK